MAALVWRLAFVASVAILAARWGCHSTDDPPPRWPGEKALNKLCNDVGVCL